MNEAVTEREGIWVVSSRGNRVWVWMDEIPQYLAQQKASQRQGLTPPEGFR